MNKNILTIFVSIVIFITVNCTYAYKSLKDVLSNEALFAIEFQNGAFVSAKADLISDFSLQKYMLGAYEVSEIVIDLLGNTSQIRIYAVNYPSLSTAANQAVQVSQSQLKNYAKTATTYAEKLDAKIEDYKPQGDTLVIKEYPITTHSKTIEFKVDYKELMLFYEDFKKDFLKCDTSSKSSQSILKTADKSSKINKKLYIFEGEVEK